MIDEISSNLALTFIDIWNLCQNISQENILNDLENVHNEKNYLTSYPLFHKEFNSLKTYIQNTFYLSQGNY